MSACLTRITFFFLVNNSKISFNNNYTHTLEHSVYWTEPTQTYKNLPPGFEVPPSMVLNCISFPAYNCTICRQYINKGFYKHTSTENNKKNNLDRKSAWTIEDLKTKEQNCTLKQWLGQSTTWIWIGKEMVREMLIFRKCIRLILK